MIFVLDGHNNYRRADREGEGEHWTLYQRARRERPDLVLDMEQAIQAAIGDPRYVDPSKSHIPNSSWLGSRILKEFARREDWNAYFPDSHLSGAIFGMIMWTVMADDPRAWCSTVTTAANAGREERVYWLKT